MQMDFITPNSNETKDFDGKLQVLKHSMQK
jgi:hypothetical protein